MCSSLRDHAAPKYNRSVLTALYILIVVTSLFDNIDHGSLPAGHKTIKAYWGMKGNSVYGSLGSFVFVGLTIGKSLIFILFFFPRLNIRDHCI